MTSRTRRTRAALRAWRDFLAGMLIGATVQTPLYAADFSPHELTERLAHGDWVAMGAAAALLLLIIGVVLRVFMRDRPPKAPPPQSENSIGRHRPQTHRG
jgi:hypothetical protein